MPISKARENVTPIREENDPVQPVRPAVMTFDYADEDDNPELQISGGPVTSQAGGSILGQGADLSARKKVVFFVGRGKTGKTTAIRWVAEKATAEGRPLLMADMDPTNDTFSKYLDGVARPAEPANPALALKWLDRLLQHALVTETSLLVDLGGGDTTLRRLVQQLPDLVSMFEAAGFAVVVIYTAGPQEEDLSPLATMMGLDFRPTASAILLNEAMGDLGETRETSFSRVFRHSAFRTALERDAIPVWMPRLLPAQQVEVRRLRFADAVDGKVGQGKSPLGPFDRARVRAWLETMDRQFAGIRSWMP